MPGKPCHGSASIQCNFNNPIKPITLMKVNFHLPIFAALFLLAATSCSDNDNDSPTPPGYIADKLPTEDIIKNTVSGAYLEYGNAENDDFAEAVMERHTLGKATVNGEKVKSVFIDNAVLPSMATGDYENIVADIMTDKTLLVVNPTTEAWNKFAYNIAVAYTDMTRDDRLPENYTEEGKNFLNMLVRDVRLARANDIYGLPIVRNEKTGVKDIFSSILTIRGNVIRSYDNDIQKKPDSLTTAEYKYDNKGNLVSSDIDDKAQAVMPKCEANDYSVGLMADDIAERIEKGDDNNTAKAPATRAEAGDLKSLMDAQEFSHVFRADNFASYYYFYQRRSCLVETKYYIWSVYDFNKDTDYYIVHQVITAHNGDLGCTDGNQQWDYVDDNRVRLGSWAGDMTNKINILDEKGNPVNGVEIIDPQPTTHLGTASHTTGINYSFGGNLGLNVLGPNGGIVGSFGFTDSYTTVTPDYATELNTSGTNINWNFNATNSHIKGYYAWNSENATHDIIPYCYRNDCTFNQSFIYKVKNPKSERYMLNAYTSLDLVNYAGINTWFYMTDKYSNYRSDTKYSFLLNPPTRHKSDWYMAIDVPQGISQESVRKFLESHYGNYWKEAFTCYTFSEGDVLPVYGIMNSLKHDINNDLASWRSAGFTGKYSIYVHPSTSSEITKKFEFTVK